MKTKPTTVKAVALSHRSLLFTAGYGEVGGACRSNPEQKLDITGASVRGDAGRSKRKKQRVLMEEGMAAFSDSRDKLRLPDKFAKLLDGREPREVTLREAGGGGRRVWDMEVVFDGEGHLYLERGWEQFARARDLQLGNVLVFTYDGDGVLDFKVFDASTCRRNYQHDDADTGSNNSFDSSSNSSSSAEMDMDDAPTSRFTVTLKERHLDVRPQQQYLKVPPEFQNAHGCEERSKLLLRMPGKSWPMNLKHNIFLVTTALLICCIIATPAPDTSPLVGNYRPISNMNDPEVLEIARWAVAEHARQANDGLQFKRVVSGMEQLVEGMNYNLSIDAVNSDGKECVYIAQVYDISWLHNRTLESFTLGPSSTGVCRLDDHPTPPPNSRSPQIRPTLLVLLSSWSLFMFIQFQ